MIYLDNNATTPVDPRVLDAMLPYFKDCFGNAASIQHEPGRIAFRGVNQARQHVAALINAKPNEIAFTSGATESNNLAIKGAARWYGGQSGRGKHIITSSIEHSSVLEAAEAMIKEGFDVTFLDPIKGSGGVVTSEQVKAACRDETCLVSIMWANNELGTINEVPQIAALCRQRRIIFHTDATQCAGKAEIDVAATGIDLLSFTGHKMYGPKGVGALFFRSTDPRVRLDPLIHGGGHENGMRSGTLNVPGIVGFGKACEIAKSDLLEDAARLTKLRDLLEQRLLAGVPGAAVNGDVNRRMPHALNIALGKTDAQQVMATVKDVALSAASACTGMDRGISHVLRRIGLEPQRAAASLRISLGRFTTLDEIEEAANRLIAAVANTKDDSEAGPQNQCANGQSVGA